MGHGNVSAYPWGPPDICPGGLILPILDERLWPKNVRVAIYLLLLLYFLLGISVVTDVFMTAIDKITSHTKKVYLAKESSARGSEVSLRPDQPEVIEVRVWNPTIANLTLMALGDYYNDDNNLLVASILKGNSNFSSKVKLILKQNTTQLILYI